jgi:hypothetical protein
LQVHFPKCLTWNIWSGHTVTLYFSHRKLHKRSEVFLATLMATSVFWDVTSCRLVNSYWRLEES